MKIAIMQPYIFPYIGYFHLIEASDNFVFYDDVNYIKKGWINKNRLLLDSKDYTFSIPVSKASQNKLINQIKPVIDTKWKKTFFKKVQHGYSKSSNYEEVSGLLERVFDEEYTDITDLCIKSIDLVYKYLGLSYEHSKSSTFSPETKDSERAIRLIDITKKYNASHYVNSIGGVNLYKKKDFKQHGITLNFIESKIVEYKQFNNTFIPNLSIIDILMFNKKERVIDYINNYELL